MPITTCRVCDGPSLGLVLDLGTTALANRFLRPEQLGEPEPAFPLRLVRCGECGLIQIDETVPREVLFSDYLYVTGWSLVNDLKLVFRTIPAIFRARSAY